MWKRPAVLLFGLMACAPADRSSEGGVDANRVARADAAPGGCFSGERVAAVDLEATVVSACAAWPSLDGMPGSATITRSGTTLTIDFGEGVVFAGTVNGSSVSIAYVHEHPWSDGCGWQATESLSGTIDDGCSLNLRYDYTEGVVDSDGSCDSPCGASSDVVFHIDVIDP